MKIIRSAYLQYFLISLVLSLAIGINLGGQDGAAGFVVILNIFAAGIVLICVIGLLGILLTAIQKNKIAIGVHVAVGADSRDIFWLVLWELTLRPALVPVLLGGVLAGGLYQLGVLKLLNVTMYLDVPVLFLCCGFSLAVLLLSALWPAFVAAGIQAGEALKGE